MKSMNQLKNTPTLKTFMRADQQKEELETIGAVQAITGDKQLNSRPEIAPTRAPSMRMEI